MSEQGNEEQQVAGVSVRSEGYTNPTAPAVGFVEPAANLASQGGSAAGLSGRLDGYTNSTASAVGFVELSSNRLHQLLIATEDG